MRIFPDANVLFSAAKSDGAIRSLLALLEKEGHTLAADLYVIEKARRNIELRYPDRLREFESILSTLQCTPTVHDPGALEPSCPLPDKDRPVLAGAVALGCEILVTGDSTHFGRFFGKTVQGVLVLSPRGLAEHLNLRPAD
ncbi:MAG: PIN domain-containing protein [Treponema sp.]|nr:PIN domain-containing protein [Treponema sp.]